MLNMIVIAVIVVLKFVAWDLIAAAVVWSISLVRDVIEHARAGERSERLRSTLEFLGFIEGENRDDK